MNKNEQLDKTKFFAAEINKKKQITSKQQHFKNSYSISRHK